VSIITRDMVAAACRRAMPDVELPENHRFDVFSSDDQVFVAACWPGGPSAPRHFFRIDMQFVEVGRPSGPYVPVSKWPEVKK